MSGQQSRRISWKEAARMIYRTDAPDVLQMNKIGYKVAQGKLEGSAKGEWVTFDSVVVYLAARAEQRRLTEYERTLAAAARRSSRRSSRQSSSGKTVSTGRPSGRGADLRESGPHGLPGRRELSPVYRLSVQDYFAAVFRRRQLTGAPAGVKTLVLIGQVIFILLPALVIGYGCVTAVSPPPEHAAVEAWLDDAVGEYQVVEWFPPEPAPGQPGKVVRVRYRYYTPSRKPVLTDRLFLVQESRVTLLTNSAADRVLGAEGQQPTSGPIRRAPL